MHSVRLRRDRICVALEHKVLVYNFADLRLLHSIETLSNPGGILALSAAAEQTILACPGLHVGQVGHAPCLGRSQFASPRKATPCLNTSVAGASSQLSPLILSLPEFLRGLLIPALFWAVVGSSNCRVQLHDCTGQPSGPQT